MKIKFLFLMLFVFALISPTAYAVTCDYNITTADLPFTISSNDTTYCLNSTLESTVGNAITFNTSVQNTTLDCQGHLINNTGVSSYGVYLSGATVTNNTVKNCEITYFSYGIYLWTQSNNNYILNNTLTYSTAGVRINGNDNILTNNTIQYNYIGVTLSCVSGNIISGGIISDSTSYSYDIECDSVGNSFRNTGFTSTRKIFLDDNPDYWFNYNNESDGTIWLNTTSPNQYPIITRTLINWNQTHMMWNDSLNRNAILRFALSGMLPNTRYFVNATNNYIYNTTALLEVVWSDSNGDFSFDLDMIKNLEYEINVVKNMPVLPSITCDYNITSLPYPINQSNKNYCMDQSLSIDGQTAITFTSGTSSSTLDCRGYVLKGNESDPTAGILISPTAQQNTIRNCVIDKFTSGIFLNSTNLNILENNTVVSYTGGNMPATFPGAMLIYYSNRTIITNNYIGYDLGGGGDGLYLRYSNNNTITGNEISIGVFGRREGIGMVYSDNNTITYNYLHHNYDSGIDLYFSKNNLIANNIVAHNEDGIYLGSNSKYNIIKQNEISFHSSEGLSISSNNLFFDNNIYNNIFGLKINGDTSTISGGSIYSNGLYDYRIYSTAENNTVISTNFTAMRKLYFGGATYWFSYKNDTDKNLGLKTKASATIAVNRTLIKWSATSMNWTDVGSGASMTYKLTGLIPNIDYYIYDDGAYYNDSQTNADGNFSFTASLSGIRTFGVMPLITQFYPSDVNVSIDGTNIDTNVGEFSTSKTITSFDDEIQASLASCTPVNGYCDVPLTFEYSNAGDLLTNSLSIIYTVGGVGTQATIFNEGLENTTLKNAWITTKTGAMCMLNTQETQLDIGDFMSFTNNTCVFGCNDFLSVRAITSCGSSDEFTGVPLGC